MLKILWAIIQFICIASFFIVLAGVISFFGVYALDLCSGKGGMSFEVKCTSDTARTFFEFGFMTVLLSATTGIPILLAGAGLIMGILKLVRR